MSKRRHSVAPTLVVLAAALAGLGALGGCGQKGPLTLPGRPAAAAPSASAPVAASPARAP